MSRDKTEGGPGKESFWSTLHGKITAITGVVVVLAGLVVALQNLTDSMGRFIGPIVGLTRRTGHGVPNVATKYCRVIPLSLKHSIGTQDLQDLLYWFYIEVENKTEEAMHITVAFSVERGPVASSVQTITHRDSVAPGDTVQRWLDPGIELTTYDQPADLVVSWRVSKNPDILLQQGTSSKIELLPRTVIDWSLQTPEGKPVPPRFMLSWLTAWVVTAEKETRNLSEKLRRGVNFSSPPENQARQWMAACYSRLFAGSAPVRVRPLSQPLPGHGRQTIRTAQSLLATRSADPLEAALLMAGVSRGFLSRLGADFALVGLPRDQNTARDRILLLAWRLPGGAWDAVEVTRASQMDFAANEEEATSRLNTLLSSQKGLLQVLDQEGSFVSPEGSAAAFDFAEAQRSFHIRGLP